jgi:hypothetical protein
VNTEKIRISRATNRRLLNAEVWVQSDSILRVICGRQSGTGTRFSSGTSVSFLPTFIPSILRTHLSSGVDTVSPSKTAVPRDSSLESEVCLLFSVAVINDTTWRR